MTWGSFWVQTDTFKMAKSRRVTILLLGILISSTLFSLLWQRGYSSWLPSIYSSPSSRPKYAFATFLTSSDSLSSPNLLPNASTIEGSHEDGYLLGARHLVYSLLHHPTTKSTYPIPFIVLITPFVSAAKRARLEADGATIIVADPIPLPKWIKPGSSRWKDVATKIRLFALTDYDKICFIDADQLVMAPLDGVFDDPATNITQTLHLEDQVMSDEPPLPPDYVFASRPDTFGADHTIPPDERDYLNAGFYVFRPSQPVFEYYIGLLQVENKFSGRFPEQDMFNYAHRRSGNMAWRPLEWRWNVNWPTVRDYKAGVKSFHGKYWDKKRGNDPTLTNIWDERMDVLEKFYREREGG